VKNKAFYSLYRPKRFEEVLGQEQTIEVLKNQSKLSMFSHAYLFHGTSGTGKTSTARILAMVLNCLERQNNGDPCGKCYSCKAIFEGNYVDVIEQDGARFSKVDETRDLVYKASLSPFNGKRKVIIIDECHRLSEASWDVLLKPIEECPPFLTWILITTQVEKVPITIKSRCQIFPFYPLRPEVVKAKFDLILRDWGIELSPSFFDGGQLKLIKENLDIAIKQGNMRACENVLEQMIIMRL